MFKCLPVHVSVTAACFWRYSLSIALQVVERRGSMSVNLRRRRGAVENGRKLKISAESRQL